MCKRCKTSLKADVAGGVGGRPVPVMICPNYRWYHLFLHTVIALGVPNR